MFACSCLIANDLKSTVECSFGVRPVMFYIFDMIVCGLQLIENGRQKIPLCSGATSRPHDGEPSKNDVIHHFS